MPFCIVTTVVPAPKSLGTSRATSATWCAFIARMTTSCAPAARVVVGRADVARDLLAAVVQHELHAVAANGVEVGAAGDERDVLARKRELGADVAADGARRR